MGINYLSRIISVLNQPIVKEIKDDKTKGWKYKAHRGVPCGVEYALTVPFGSSFEDAHKCLKSLIATCGKLVELEDWHGAIVVRVIERDFPDSRKLFNRKHILVDHLLIGYNRMLEPMYHPLNVHMLIGGASRSGKTDAIRFWNYQFILQGYEVLVCDLKGYSFFPFEGLIKIAKNLKESYKMLAGVIEELDNRRSIIDAHRSRDIIDTFRPIVVVIDEAASLAPSQNSGPAKDFAKKCDEFISLLGQQSREPKIFCLYATQRPDMNIINKQFKSNVESSIAFRTKDLVNSRIILDKDGAEKISPETPGRCIYSYDRYHLLQVPYIGGDREWNKLLAPLKQEVVYGGSSQRVNKERTNIDGTFQRSDSDNSTNNNVLQLQLQSDKESKSASKRTFERENSRMGLAQETEDLATHEKGTKSHADRTDEI